MIFRIINLTSSELIAELHERELAFGLAHQLAMDHDYKERFGVIELTLVYETPLLQHDADEQD